MKLTLSNIEKQYFGHQATLKNMNLQFDSNDGIIGIYGTQGAGKTTLLKLLAGIEKPTAGKILLDEQVIESHKNFVMTFDDYAMEGKKTVKETLLYPLLLRKCSQTEQEEALKKIDFLFHFQSVFYRTKIKDLSERGKTDVMLARAFMREANVYLLDNPLSHLSIQERSDYAYELALLLRKLKGIIIVATDSQEEALIMSDKLLVMRQGEACDFATPEEVYRRLQNIACANIFRPDTNYFAVTVQKEAIEWKGHRIKCSASEKIGAFYLGKEVFAGVLPENIVLGEGTFTADIIQCVFRGEYTEYILSFEGEEIKVRSSKRLKRFDSIQFTVRFETAQFYDKMNSASVMKRS